MDNNAKIMVAGCRGMVGSALCRALGKQGCRNVIEVGRGDVDFTNQSETNKFINDHAPEYLVLAAAKVGGIMANDSYPADFLYDNIMIETNVIHASYLAGVKKLLFLGSSCIYPKLAPQPLKEESLLTGPLEPTNEAYAIAKITGIKLCDAYFRQHGCRFVSAMPCNLYGIGDNFHSRNSHVIPGLMRRFHEAKIAVTPSVTCWGTGNAKREFMFVDDLAEALLFVMYRFEGPGFVNVGTEEEVTIGELAQRIAKVVGYNGEIRWDHSKPDGTPRKILDGSRLRDLGWRSSVSLEEGIEKTYRWFLEHQDDYRG